MGYGDQTWDYTDAQRCWCMPCDRARAKFRPQALWNEPVGGLSVALLGTMQQISSPVNRLLCAPSLARPSKQAPCRASPCALQPAHIIAKTYDSIAEVYGMQQDFENASLWCEKGVTKLSAIYSPNSLEVCVVLY